MTIPNQRNISTELNHDPAFTSATEQATAGTPVSSAPELEPAVELASAAPYTEQNQHQNSAQIYEGISNFIYQRLARTQGITLDKTPTTYRIITNVLLLAIEVNRNVSASAISAAEIVSSMLRIVTDTSYRNQLIAQSKERASVEFWTIDYPGLAGNASGQALTFVRECLQTLLR